jgi:uncharacterized protein YcaQ
VQIDTINVVERAHHHILHARFDAYEPRMLAKLSERDRKLFEHWTHDASLIPVRWFGHWRLRFEGLRRRMDAGRWPDRLGPDGDRVVRHVLDRIRDEGPLRSRDFEHEGASGDFWWSGKPQKVALEYLWRAGDITVARREQFQKVFDLTERVIPDFHAIEPSESEAHVAWACREALDRLAVANAGELAGFFGAVSAKQAEGWARERVEAGDLLEVRVESVDGSRPRRAFALPDWERLARRVPDAPARTRLLSPFDPVIRDRQRLRRLFGFDYAVEIFVPPAKRRFGYYVLPILEGERFVGRLDPKLNRERGVLEVARLWWQPNVKPTRTRRRALERALDRLATQIGAADWELAPRAERPLLR